MREDDSPTSIVKGDANLEIHSEIAQTAKGIWFVTSLNIEKRMGLAPLLENDEAFDFVANREFTTVARESFELNKLTPIDQLESNPFDLSLPDDAIVTNKILGTQDIPDGEFAKISEEVDEGVRSNSSSNYSSYFYIVAIVVFACGFILATRRYQNSKR